MSIGPKLTVEVTTRIIAENGPVIENVVRAKDALPGFNDIDLTTMEGVKETFGTYEEVSLLLYREAQKATAEAYAKVAAQKKN